MYWVGHVKGGHLRWLPPGPSHSSGGRVLPNLRSPAAGQCDGGLAGGGRPLHFQGRGAALLWDELRPRGPVGLGGSGLPSTSSRGEPSKWALPNPSPAFIYFSQIQWRKFSFCNEILIGILARFWELAESDNMKFVSQTIPKNK